MGKVHVALLGKEVLPVFYPIQEFKLKDICVIGTAENRKIYENLKSVCGYVGSKTQFFEVGAYDMKEVVNVCEEIHEKYPDGTDFIYNVTGGTKPMALAAFIVAKRHGAEVIYTDSKSCLNMDTFESKPISETLGIRIIFLLQGQKLKNYHPWPQDGASDVEVSRRILDFIKKNRALYNVLRKRYIARNGLFNDFNEEGCRYSFYDNELTIEKVGRRLLSIYSKDAKKLLFEGRWWERLVSDAMWKWSAGRCEIGTDVVFDSPAGGADKNEVDILINVGNTMVFVECKSGELSQNEIYKLAAVKSTYGSDKSKSVLVTFWPLREDLRQKAEESRIFVIEPENAGQDILSKIPKKMDEIASKLTL